MNHIDIAPSYGEAELRVAPWLVHERHRFFVGCKTTERTAEGARLEMRRSLERLGLGSFDLYQLHAVNTYAELSSVLAPHGALQALLLLDQPAHHLGNGRGTLDDRIAERLRRFA